jgi:hypothetical protein
MRLEFTYNPADLEEMAKADPSLRLSTGLVMSGKRRMIGWMIFATLVAVLCIYFVDRKQEAPPVVSPTARWAARIVPGLLVIGFVWFFGLQQVRANSPQSVWERTPSLQQPKVLEISEGGVILFDALRSTEWRWESFTEFAETTHFFVLMQAQKPTLMIPKRAVTPAEIKALRSQLARRMPEHATTAT